MPKEIEVQAIDQRVLGVLKGRHEQQRKFDSACDHLLRAEETIESEIVRMRGPVERRVWKWVMEIHKDRVGRLRNDVGRLKNGKKDMKRWIDEKGRGI